MFFKREADVTRLKIAALNAGQVVEVIFGAPGQPALAPHSVDESFALAPLARMLSIIRIVDGMRDFVKQRPFARRMLESCARQMILSSLASTEYALTFTAQQAKRSSKNSSLTALERKSGLLFFSLLTTTFLLRNAHVT